MDTPGQLEREGEREVSEVCVSCSVCLTKLDILDDFDEMKVGVAYTIDGSPVEGMPGE